jgi:TonB-dependent siderophore receptor
MSVPVEFKEIAVPLHRKNEKVSAWPVLPEGGVSRVAAAVLGVLALSLSVHDARAQAMPDGHAQHSPIMEFDMPAQPLAAALRTFSEKAPARMHLVYDSAWLAGKQAPALRGSYNPRDALDRLLQGSGIVVVQAAQGVIELGLADAAQSHAAAHLPADNRSVAVLPQVTVLSAHLPGQTENTGLYTPEAVTVGGKVEQSLREVPRSISTITRTQLDDQGITTLEDALEQLPGVTISPADHFSAATYTARGFTIQKILVDGSIVGGHDGMDSSVNTSLAMYDNVQLLRGPDALFSGQGLPGASINLTRKRPTQGFQAKAALSAGSWSNYLGEMDISSPLNASGSIRGRVVASYNDKEQFWDNAESKRSQFYGVVDVDLAPRSTVTLGASKTRQWGTGGISNPGLPRYTNGDPLPIPRSMGTTLYDHRNTDSESYFASLQHQLENNWKLKLSAVHTESLTDLRISRYQGAVTPGMTTGSTLAMWGGNTENRVNTLDFNLSGDFNWLDRSHSFVVGGDYRKTKNYNDRGPYGTVARIDWATWDPSAPFTLPAWSARQGWNNDITDQKLYGYGKFQLHGPVRLVLGGSYSNYKVDQIHISDVVTGHQRTTGTFTPYTALMVDVAPQWTACFTTARGIQDQSDYYTPAYEPMSEAKSRSYELGLKGELMDGRLNTNITFYDMQRDNVATRLYNDANFDEEGHYCCYVGADAQSSRGVEIDVSGAITPSWQVNAGYTFDDNQSEYGSEDGNRYASFTPRHTLRLWSSYRLSGAASGWRVGGGIKAQSKAFSSGTVRTWNEATQDYTGPAVPYDFFSSGRAVYSLFAQHQIAKDWQLALNVDNLFDKKYFMTTGSTSTGNFYGAPRSFRVTLRGTF